MTVYKCKEGWDRTGIDKKNVYQLPESCCMSRRNCASLEHMDLYYLNSVECYMLQLPQGMSWVEVSGGEGELFQVMRTIHLRNPRQD